MKISKEELKDIILNDYDETEIYNDYYVVKTERINKKFINIDIYSNDIPGVLSEYKSEVKEIEGLYYSCKDLLDEYLQDDYDYGQLYFSGY